ncbi:hypothetical protein PRECH8_08420 [Insulibacter thermoxylanivorax]|uniref:Pyridoxamine kinase/Phosphomethylpyrimidine kinase domain-containing protein n=1 Tax=Insulibacter thermoxylanivorax TaxID=2749268 RepID=A0A916QFG7_9BACL|nr:hypothetical protein PRECH8_08420 [Insulibacter thermoxylanivorax]
MEKIAKALTIAGSDSGGGAGIQADLKTFQERNVFGMSVITAITAQNTLGVQGVYPQSAACIAAQIDSVLSDLGADAVKTGMLFSAEIIRLIAEKIRRYKVERLVVDPVMYAKGGRRSPAGGGDGSPAARSAAAGVYDHAEYSGSLPPAWHRSDPE